MLHGRYVALHRFHLNMRVSLMEGWIDLREHIYAALGNQSHRKVAAVFFRPVGNAGIGVFLEQEHLPRRIQIGVSGLRGLPVAACTDEQRRTQLVFQLLQLLIQGALRNIALLRSPRDASFVRYADDVFQQMQIHFSRLRTRASH